MILDPNKRADRDLAARGVFNTFEGAGWDEHQIAEMARILIVVAQLALTDRLRSGRQEAGDKIEHIVPRYVGVTGH